jgi:hypothetical protein
MRVFTGISFYWNHGKFHKIRTYFLWFDFYMKELDSFPPLWIHGPQNHPAAVMRCFVCAGKVTNTKLVPSVNFFTSTDIGQVYTYIRSLITYLGVGMRWMKWLTNISESKVNALVMLEHTWILTHSFLDSSTLAVVAYGRVLAACAAEHSTVSI